MSNSRPAIDSVVPAKPRCGIVIRCESVNQTSGGKKRMKFLLTFHCHGAYTFSYLAHPPHGGGPCWCMCNVSGGSGI